MYDRTDPRATLNAPPTDRSAAASAAPRPVPAGFGAAEYVKFYERAPDVVAPGVRTWLARGQNFIVAYSELEAGAELARPAQIDEYVVLSPERGAATTISANGVVREVAARSIVFVPPGASNVRATTSGSLVRLFTTRSDDLVRTCANADSYHHPKPNVAPLEPWPVPPDGYQLRVYSTDVPPAPGRFGRIWRGTTLMVNCLYPDGPRDPAKMSPHHHDDFEQGSLALEGEYVHHLRWPWITDMTQWRADEHELCKSPSIAVIPPPAVHTSQSIAAGGNTLVDVFCPPRHDFSAQPGWVLNAADYPVLS